MTKKEDISKVLLRAAAALEAGGGITKKMVTGYNKARKAAAFSAAGSGGISFNDGWNMSKFGITKDQYDTVHKAVLEKFGPYDTPTKVKFTDLSASISAAINLSDFDGKEVMISYAGEGKFDGKKVKKGAPRWLLKNSSEQSSEISVPYKVWKKANLPDLTPSNDGTGKDPKKQALSYLLQSYIKKNLLDMSDRMALQKWAVSEVGKQEAISFLVDAFDKNNGNTPKGVRGLRG